MSFYASMDGGGVSSMVDLILKYMDALPSVRFPSFSVICTM